MGLRSPQDIARPQLRPIGGTELRGGVNPVSGNFIRAAEQTVDTALKQQQARDDLSFKVAKAQYEVGNDEDRLKAERDLALLEKQNALVEGPKIREALKKRLEERYEKLPEQFKPLLQVEPTRTLNDFNKFSYKYEAQQAQKLASDTFKQRMAVGVNKAISNSADPFRFNQDLESVVLEAKQVAEMSYGKDPKADLGNGFTAGEMVNEYQKNAVSNTILRSAQQQLAEGRFDIADRIAKNYSVQILPADKKKLQESLSLAIRRGETKVGESLAEEARKNFSDDPIQRDNFIKANSPNEAILKSAREFDRYQTALEKDAEKSQAEEAMAKFSDKAMAPGARITSEDILALPPSMRSRAIDFATKVKNNTPIDSDPNEYQRLVDMAKNNPDQFMRTNIPRDMLDREDYKTLTTQQKGMQEAEKNEELRVQRSTERIVDDIVLREASARGIRKSNKVQWNKLHSNVRAEFERQLTFKPRNINELRRNMELALKERTFVEKEKPKTGLFGLFGLLSTTVSEVDDTMAPQGDELDTSMLDAARRESRRRGLNLTEAQLEQYVRSKQKK